jgi:anaerobic magnesium-protoporphyrin IX monomethyl ester cyclase
MEYTADRAMSSFRIILVNLCEDACGYGPSSSEYLRAELLASPDLRDRIEVEILFLENCTGERAAELVLAAQPDLVGFTCFSWSIRESGEVARILKQRAAELPIVWGGVSFALFPERHDWFTWWDCVDAVAVGSGEYTLVELVRHLIVQDRPRRIEHALPGLVVCRERRLEFGPPANVPESLDEFASPYLAGVRHVCMQPYIEMARGCRFQCTFCSDARASRENAWRVHSVERIAGEIEVVSRWPNVGIIDAGSSTANINDEEFERVCEAIRLGDPEQRLSFTFQMYPALSRPSQRAALQGIRIDKLCFGVQSTTAETWGPIKRKTTLDHMRRAMQVFEGVGPIQASLLLGLPGETYASFRKTFEELRALGYVICVNRLLLLPGTQLHRDHERFGLECDPDLYYRVTKTPTMDEDDLRRAMDFVMECAWSAPRSAGRYPPVMWTNFYLQETMFAPIQFTRPAGHGDQKSV